jgi:hypothetical protein
VAPAPKRSLSTPIKSSPPNQNLTPSQSQFGQLASGSGSARSPSNSRQNSLRAKGDVESMVELQKYSEEDDEDYEDMLDATGEAVSGELLVLGRSEKLVS